MTGITIHPDNLKVVDTSTIDNCGVCLGRADQYFPPDTVAIGRREVLWGIYEALRVHEEENHADHNAALANKT